MIKKSAISFLLFIFACTACNKQDVTPQIPTGTFDVKNYKAERHPTINRMGFGMDFVHDSLSTDTLYLTTSMYQSSFKWDLLLYNEMSYYQNNVGDWVSVGNPVIFIYTDTINPENSVKAYKVGEGQTFFTQFTSINQNMIDSLKADTWVNLQKARDSKTGYLLRDSILELYNKLIIGNNFRAVSLQERLDAGEKEADIQPVYLVQTRDKYYAKFMVYQYKGNGVDVQKTLIRWQVFDGENIH